MVRPMVQSKMTLDHFAETPNSPVSFFYDNGTGNLEPHLAYQLATPKRTPIQTQYSGTSPLNSPLASLDRQERVQASSMSQSGYRQPYGNLWSGLGAQYAKNVQSSVLQTKTRTSKSQGSWLSAGTLRKTSDERGRSKGWSFTEKKATMGNRLGEETNGWYD